MKKGFVIILLLVAVAALLFKDQLMALIRPMAGNIVGMGIDPFTSYRQNVGAFQEDPTASYNSLRKFVAEAYGLDEVNDRQQVDELWHTAIAFHKAYDIEANGWHFPRNQWLIDEVASFYQVMGAITANSVTQGQLAYA